MEWVESEEKWLVLESPKENEIESWPIDPQGTHRIWRVNPDGAQEGIRSGDIGVVRKAGRLEVSKKTYMPEGKKPKTVWYGSGYSATTYGTKLLNDILGSHDFSYPKSVFLMIDCLRMWLSENSTVVDYFAGSGTTGHAVINLNREDGGQRKFILVEMGDYFDTVLLPRIKKVTYTPEWRNGKPRREATDEEAESSPRVIKYIRMESYEDALDGIEFDDNLGRMNLEDRIQDYLLKYMLKWETQNSQTLLNVENLGSPFDYRLRAHVNGGDRERNADVAETFNYLLGLNVRTRRVHYDGDTRYIVYRGETRESPGREVVVIWRDTKGWTVEDHELDRRFVAEHILADGYDTAYVNSPSCIAGTKPVEPIFHARMFAPVTA